MIDTIKPQMNYWDSSWDLDPASCPCDLHFLDFLRDREIRDSAIFHFGTGSHHVVGLRLAEGDSGNAVLGITASPEEYQAYVRLAIERPRVTKSYKAYFGDIYLLDSRLLPRFDLVTLFHLCEFWSAKNEAYGGLTDLALAELLYDRLRPGGLMLFYKGSSAFGEARQVVDRLRASRAFDAVEHYQSLLVLRKASPPRGLWGRLFAKARDARATRPLANPRRGSGPIPVVFCFDRGYAPYAAVATASLLASSKSALRVYWITPEADAEVAASYRARLARWRIPIEVIPADLGSFDSWRLVPILLHNSRSTLLRLLIPDLVQEDRVVYLDSDVVVRSDLAALFATDLEGCPIAGVPEAGILKWGAAPGMMPRSAGDSYINAGVLLLDLAAMRREDFFNKCEEIVTRYGSQCIYADQCILNKYAEGRKVPLAADWNCQLFANAPGEVGWPGLATLSEVKVVHFLGSTKPWSAWCDPRIVAFWQSSAREAGLESLAPSASILKQMRAADGVAMEGTAFAIPASTSGIALFGPYLALLSGGRYEASLLFDLEPTSEGGPLFSIDVVNEGGKDSYLWQDFDSSTIASGPDGCRVRLRFEIPPGAANPEAVEIRLWAKGGVRITVREITLSSLPEPVPGQPGKS